MRVIAAFVIVVVFIGCERPVDTPPRPSAAPATTPTIATASSAATVTATASPSRTAIPTSTAAAERPTADDERIVALLVAYARARDGRTFAALPLAADVGLELDDQIPLPVPATRLSRPEAWVIDVNVFNGRVGPFSALDLLARDTPTSLTVGPHSRCASPMTPTPAALAEYRRISVQPSGIDTCVLWWAVDVYVSRDGKITTVALDLWNP